MKKVNKFKLLAAGLLIGVAFWLLGSDFFTFMIWWEILWILGLVFMPITAQIFKGFDDNGWMYSKVIAIVICGYGVWILTSIAFSVRFPKITFRSNADIHKSDGTRTSYST